MAKQFIPIIDDDSDLTPPAGADGSNQDRGFTPIVDEDDPVPRPEGVPPEATETEPGKWEWSAGPGDGPPLAGAGTEPAGPQVFYDKAKYKGPDQQLTVPGDQALGDKLVRGVTRGGLKALKEGAKLGAMASGAILPGTTAAEGAEQVNELVGDLGKPQSITEGLAEGISQFTVGFVGAGKLLQAGKVLQGATTATTLARATLQGAIADAAAFDPLEGRLSNLVEEYPSLHNPITEYLAAKPDDGQAEGRLKNALEGAVIGNVLEGLMAAVRGLRRIRTTRVEKGDAAALKEQEKVIEEVQAASEPKAPTADPMAAEAPKAPEATQGTPKASEPAPGQMLSQETKDRLVESIRADSEDPAVGIDLNFDKMEDGGLALLNEMSEAIAPEIAKRKGGVQTLKEINELSDILGKKPEELAVALKADAAEAAGVAARLVAGKKVLQRLAVEVTGEAQKVLNGVATPERINNLLERQAELQESVIAVRASAARTTSAGRITTGPAELASSTLDKLGTPKPAEAPKVKPKVTAEKLEQIKSKRKALFDELSAPKPRKMPDGSLGNKSRLGAANTGDLAEAVVDLGKASKTLVKIAGTYVEEGVVRVEDFIKAIRADAGDKVADIKDAELEQAFTEASKAGDEATAPVKAPKKRKAPVINSGDVASQQLLRAIVAAGGDPTALRKLTAPRSLFAKGTDFITEYRINAMLSGPKTHLVNMLSNTAMMAIRPAERMLGGDVRGGLAEYMGMMTGAWDSIQMASKSLMMEESVLDPLVIKQEAARFGTSAKALGANPNSTFGQALDWMGKAVRMPTRFLVAEDEFFKQMNYRASVYATATREAAEKGLPADKIGAYVAQRVDEFFESGGKAIDPDALREARVASFQEDLQGFAQRTASFLNSHPFTRFIAPFVKTPINIMKQAAIRTPPVALLMDSFRNELKAGGSRAARARGQLAMGGMLWTGALGLAFNGKLTGRGPSDPDQRATKMATGWKPYSYVNANGEYVSFERMDPWGMFLGISADIAEMGGQMKEEELSEFAVVATAALARNLASKTYLRGITDALGAMTSGDPNKFQRFLNSSAGSFVPSGLQQGAALVGQGDNTMREVKSVLDAMRARIPGLSDNLPPRRNYLGEPVTFPPGWGPDSISPITLSPTSSDPVKQELARLEAGIGMPAEKLAKGRINLRAFTKSSGQDAYDRMLELRQTHKVGRYTLQESLEKLITSDRYKRLPDSTDTYSSEKLRLIQEVFGKYQESIERQVREEYPDLKAAIKADEDNKRLMKRPSGGNPIEDLLKPLTAP